MFEELFRKFHALHEIVVKREKRARELLRTGASLEDYKSFVEKLIIDGADACEYYGPCPNCALRQRHCQKRSPDCIQCDRPQDHSPPCSFERKNMQDFEAGWKDGLLQAALMLEVSGHNESAAELRKIRARGLPDTSLG